MLGALCHYIAHADPDDYQPTNAAFGLLPEPPPGSPRASGTGGWPAPTGRSRRSTPGSPKRGEGARRWSGRERASAVRRRPSTRFLDYLRDQRRVSPQTLRAYRSDLEQFGEYLAERAPRTAAAPGPEEIDALAVRGFVARLSRERPGQVRRSRASSPRCARSCGTPCARAGIESNPAEAIRAPRVPAAAAARPDRGRDVQPARPHPGRRSRGAARPRDPRAALRRRAARQRAGRPGPGRPRPDGADRARAGQGQQGAARALRPARPPRRCAAGSTRSRAAARRGRRAARRSSSTCAAAG